MLTGISNLVGGQTGVNSGQLVNDLVAATREAKLAPLLQRQSQNQSRISALGSASSALNTFADALKEILDGRRFAGDLVSSRGDLASVTFISGALPEGLPATLEVSQLASAQRLVSASVATADTAVGEGSLTLATASGSFAITIDSTNNSLAGLRDAINTAQSDVTASIVTDKNGARLVLTGKEGAGNDFTLTGSGGGAALDAYAYPQAGGVGMTQLATAQDSVVKVNGIEMVNSTNQLDNAITGVRVNLLAAAPGTSFTISGDQPSTTVRDLVTEFVAAYNDLRTALNEATAPGGEGASGGPLAGNRAVREMVRKLGGMSSTQLVASGPYLNLADIGVRTERDGTLSVDSARLDQVLNDDPQAVARMLEPAVQDAANPGIAGTLDAIRESLQSSTGSLTLAQERLQSIGKDLAEQLEKAEEASAVYREQLERTFQNMDRQLAVLRSTQSYLEQQISIWNNSDN